MAKDWRFQSLIAAKMTVMAHRRYAPCNHRQALDLVKLRDRFGPDAPEMADDLIPKLKCSRCGGVDVGLMYTPNTSPTGYGRAKGT